MASQVNDKPMVVSLPIWSVMRRYGLVVKVVGLRRFRVRTWIAIRLMCVVARLLGMNVEWCWEFPATEIGADDA
jgi:hypothetical protein